jgi:flagellar biosynthesis GTPase FlhF
VVKCATERAQKTFVANRAAVLALPQDRVPLDELAAAGHGLIMVMGKGGLGTTTVAAALALGPVQCSNSVHLIATDPAAHRAER